MRMRFVVRSLGTCADKEECAGGWGRVRCRIGGRTNWLFPRDFPTGTSKFWSTPAMTKAQICVLICGLSLLGGRLAAGQDLAEEMIAPDELPALKSPSQGSKSPIKPLSEIRFERRIDTPELTYPEIKTLPAPPPDPRVLPPVGVHWRASELHYNRPYFEEVLLERHGLSHHPRSQPVWSGLRFYSTAALLPVLRQIAPDCELYYHRTYGNPGSPLGEDLCPVPRAILTVRVGPWCYELPLGPVPVRMAAHGRSRNLTRCESPAAGPAR